MATDKASRDVQRSKIVARTLIGLKHRLAMKDELDAFFEKQEEALQAGILISAEATLKELLGQ